MPRNLIFVRAGDGSLHWSWAVDRTRRNYDLFISYFGSQPGRYQKDGEYYEATPGLKFPALARLLKNRPELFRSYDAIWVPDDDLMISASAINRMFDLFHKYKLKIAQPALAPGSYLAHSVTAMVPKQSLHFSQYVEVMCPIFSQSALKALAHTFTLTVSSWGIDFLWGHLLGYPKRRIAILDETPLVHTRPVGKGTFYDALKGKSTDASAENLKIIRKYKIDWDSLRRRVCGSVPASSRARANSPGALLSLFALQQMIDKECRHPIFYENRVNRLRLKADERPDYKTSDQSHSSGVLIANENKSAVRLKRLMGSRRRLQAIAEDIIRHWTVRRQSVHGKAMVVCTDQRTCLRLYRWLIRLRPEWKRDGSLAVAPEAVIPSGNSLPQEHSGSDVAEQFKRAEGPLQMVLVDNLHRHEYDCPLLSTLYLDFVIPVDQHIQCVRRLMRVFQNRLGTLVVDYLGLSDVIFQQHQSQVPKATPPVAAQGSAMTGKSVPRKQRLRPMGRTAVMTRGNALADMPPGRRIAHLFLVRDNLNHDSIWEEFFRGYEKHYNIYVHAKNPEKVTSELLKDRHIARRCETAYGQVSLVKAELLLLRAALKDKENQFFVLHSESCVPIRPFEYIYRKLFKIGRSWLFSFKGDMWRYYRTNMTAIPHEFFFKSSQFFCLTRSHVESVLANGRLADWRRSDCPDEHFIPTVLAMAGRLGECLPRPLTFVDWDRKRRETPFGPTTFHRLSQNDLAALLRSESLFARKFAPDSDISRHIRKLHSRPDTSRPDDLIGQPLELVRSERRRVALLAA